MRLLNCLFLLLVILTVGCTPLPPTANSGATQVSVQIPTDAEGITVEQRNVARRLLEDNQPGATKEFYSFSPLTGDALFHATVAGKVTSSGKRLSPTTITSTNTSHGMSIRIGGILFGTEEVIQDDGTYGDSVPYIYFFDQEDNYYQYFFTGGQIIHISSAPMRLRKPPINDLN